MEQAVYIKVKKAVLDILNINLDSYKDEQMKRRLDAWLVRAGTSTWEEYFTRVRSDAAENSRFRNYLTINVTEFFRDIEKWTYLRQNIIPELMKDANHSRLLGDGLKIWSAGCSIGAEPYTLAMSLDEVAHGRKHAVSASDLDRGALAKAKAGGPYMEEEIKQVTAAQRASYFKPGGPPYYINPKLISQINFREHNLLADPYEKELDLIVCRNVVIYFTTEAKDYIFQHFHDALRMGGVLFLGGTEIIPRPQELGFASHGISFYKRIK
jgi:chemotaxis protein methyltransferase CheR